MSLKYQSSWKPLTPRTTASFPLFPTLATLDIVFLLTMNPKNRTMLIGGKVLGLTEGIQDETLQQRSSLSRR